MASSTIRIVTRESPLAMWQAGFVRDSLCALHPGIKVEILGITTQADRLLDSSLESLGGKGAFVKELEQALLEGQAEIAVHSMKDVTIDLPANLIVPVVLKEKTLATFLFPITFHVLLICRWRHESALRAYVVAVS